MAQQTTSSDSALSGGLLVILGIIVACVIGYFALGGTVGHSSQHITVDVPSAPSASAPAAPSAPSTSNQ